MLRLLHISDLHFGPKFLPSVGDALLAIAPGLAPDIIVASGDFTQRAKRKQFAAAKEFLGRLPPRPLVTCPGNHDVPLYRVYERVFCPYRNYREQFGSEADSVMHDERAVIVTLNTTSPLRRITEGRIHPSQLEFCAAQFRLAAPGAARIVVAHHHFAPAPDFEHHGGAMPGAKHALRKLAELDVDLILGGHLHRSYIGSSLDVCPASNGCRAIVIVECGTTTSNRGRGRERLKNSFNLIEIIDSQIEITHYLYFDESSQFFATSRHLFPRGKNAHLGSDSSAKLK